MKLVFFVHHLTQSIRHLIILSSFGTISYCKHSPTCSQYSLQVMKKEGYLKGIMKGTWRVLQCW